MKKIGLIAGNRRFPIIVSQGAQRQNVSVVAVAVKGETNPQLKKYVDKIFWISLGQLSRMYEIFKSEGVAEVMMAGQISPVKLFSREVKDSKEIQQVLAGIKDHRANSIFAAIAEQLKRHGLNLIDSTTFVKEYLPQKGVLTRRQPTAEEWDDIRFGIELAKKVAGLDIGLSVGVKNKAIVAVEALEGTDNLILRAGKIARSGVVIAKAGRPGQDMRFDIPVIGLHTISALLRAHSRCMVVEAGKTLIIDMEQSVQRADAKGITLVAA